MIVYFANRYMTILGMASTELPEGFSLRRDVKEIDIESGIASFEMELIYTNELHLKAKEMVAAGNYILRYNNDDYEFYTIIDTEDNTTSNTIYLYAEDAGLDLLNEVVQPYSASSAQSVEFYINRFTRDSGFEIGINEIATRTRKLSWDGEATAAERVRSVATQFDAEIGYSFDIDKLQVKHKYINIYEKRGRDTGVELRLGREIEEISVKTSIANLATCLRVTGGTPEGNDTPINLRGYSYDDGDIYIDQTWGDLKSRSALEKWSRYLSETGTGDGHIVGRYSYDTTSQSELCSRAISHLKEVRVPAVNYEIDLRYLPRELRIGDTVRIIDDNGELYLSARLLAIKESITDDIYHTTLGDFLVKSSGISEKVAELAEKYAELAKTRTLYTWIAYADDASGTGISTDPTNKSYIGIAPNRVSETPDLSDPSVFTWALIEGGTGPAGTSFRNKGAWAASTAYVSNSSYIDVVTYNGNSYACITSHTSGSTFDSSKWTLMAAKGEDGDTPVITGSKSGDTTTIYSDGTQIAQIVDGADGDDGTTFTPSVDTSGNISWTNDGGKTNPTTRNIKGPQGDAGPEALVTIEVTAINYVAGTATLKAVLRVNGTVTTPTAYKWTKGTSTTSLGTAQSLSVTSLNEVYHCTCTWSGGTQTGSLDLKGLKVAGDDAKAAMTSASGKNTIYRAAVQPSSNLVEGDVWFDSANDNKIYRYTNGAWTAVALGDDALDNLSANKITTGTLDASQVTVSNLDGGVITAGTITANQIAAKSIGATQLAVSDTTNLIQANELYENSIPFYDNSNKVVVSNGYLTKNSATQTYLMGTVLAPNTLKKDDELYYEFYGYAATAGDVTLRCWSYNSSGTNTAAYRQTISLTTTEAFYSGTIKLSDIAYTEAVKYTIGFHDGRSTKSQIYIRKWIVRRKNGGELIVDGSITANKLNVNSINASNSLTIGSINLTDSATAAAIDNSAIEIGGRNLLLGTRDWSTKSTSNQTGISISSDVYSGTLVLVGTRSSGNMDMGRFQGKFSMDLKPDTDYTLSFWAKASAAVNVYSNLYSPATVVSGKNSLGNTTTATDGQITTTLSTSWEHYWVTWHTSTAASQATYLIAARLTSGTDTIYLAGVKFEEGNKATGYTEAPEDLRVGGRNLIRFTDYSIYGASAYGKASGSTYTFADDRVTIGYGSELFKQPYAGQRISTIIPSGTRIICSVYVYQQTISTGNHRIYVAPIKSDNTVNWTNIKSIDANFTGLLTWEWTTVADTYGFVVDFDTRSATSGQMVLGRVKAEIGNKATDWTPAPEDSNYFTFDSTTGLDVGYSGTNAKTRINGSGVSIYANDTNNYATVDSNGMRVYKNINSVSTQVASLGEVVTLGETGKTRQELDYHSLILYDKDGKEYFHVSDQRGADGTITLTENFTGDGTTKNFDAQYTKTAGTTPTVTINGTATTDFTATGMGDSDGGHLRITFTTAPADGAAIVLVYSSDSDKMKAYTFGNRQSNSTIGHMSVAEGHKVIASGAEAHAEGYYSTASGDISHAEGANTIASGGYSHAEGHDTEASGYYSHAEGYNTTASEWSTHAEGYATVASDRYSHAEGDGTTASGRASHAEGDGSQATNKYGHAEGYGTKATGNLAAHSEGYRTVASGDYGAHAEGSETTASGSYSHVEGRGGTASGSVSHAQNYYTIADGNYQTAIGKYNVSNTNSALIIGNGTADDARSNALTVDFSGNVVAAGNISASAGIRAPYVQAIGTASSQNLSGTSVTQVTLGSKSLSYEPNSDFTISSGGVMCNKTGTYRITASAYVVPVASTNHVGTYVKVGTAFSSATEVMGTLTATAGQTIGRGVGLVPKLVSITAGQIVFLAARTTSAQGTVQPNNTATYLLIERIA